MKKIIFALLVVTLVLPGCVKSSAKCKSDAKKAKKNHIGWKY